MGEARQEAPPLPRWYQWHPWLTLVALALLLSAAAAVAWQGRTSLRAPAYHGTVLEPPLETVPFRLTNQDGKGVAWADYRGKVVVLTFLYTSCPDLCPLTTAKLHRAHELLGAEAGKVALVAITVDPDRDTVEAVRRYSEERDMLGRWDFLVGSEEGLRPLWQAYWAGPVRVEAVAQGDTGSEADGEVIEHSAPIHLIDAEGRGRVVFSSEFQPENLVADLRLLLRGDR